MNVFENYLKNEIGYKSPIDIIYGETQMQLEGEVLKATQNVGVYVDKEELIKALEYDRDQYNKGYKDGLNADRWIPVEERLPDSDRYILMHFANFSLPAIGRYEEDEEGGAFYIGDEDETCVQQDLFVNAWMELPERYTEN